MKKIIKKVKKIKEVTASEPAPIIEEVTVSEPMIKELKTTKLVLSFPSEDMNKVVEKINEIIDLI